MNFEEYLNLVGVGKYQLLIFLILGISVFRSTFDLEVLVLQCIIPPHTCNHSDINATLTDDVCFVNKGNFTERCSSIVFNFSTSTMSATMSTDLNLICDTRWWLEFMQSMYFVGYVLGFSFGCLADKIGRRKVIVICGLLDLVTSPLPVFFHNPAVQSIIRLLRGIPGVVFVFSVTLLSEMCPTNMRSMAVNIGYLFWCFGYIFAALFGYLLRDWILLQYTCIIPSSYVLLAAFIPESPAWLLLHGRQSEARVTCKFIAKMNNVKIEEETLDQVVRHQPCCSTDQSNQCSDLFKTALMRRYTFIIWFALFAFALSYYGLSIDSTFVHTNPFLTIGLHGIVEVPTVFFSWFLAEKLGRRLSTISTTILTGVFVIVTPQIPRAWGSGSARAAVAVSGMFALNTAYLLKCLYSVEVFPTSVRYIGGSSGWCLGTLGVIVAPYINLAHKIHYAIPSIIFGGITFIIAITICGLPETKDKILPQTVEEVEAVFLPQRSSSNEEDEINL